MMIVVWGVILACHLSAQKNGRTEVFSNRVKSLQVKVAGEQISEPYIELWYLISVPELASRW